MFSFLNPQSPYVEILARLSHIKKQSITLYVLGTMPHSRDIKLKEGPGRVAQPVRAWSLYTKAFWGSIPGQGAYKSQPMNA